jgi:hypothetical protein
MLIPKIQDIINKFEPDGKVIKHTATSRQMTHEGISVYKEAIRALEKQPKVGPL